MVIHRLIASGRFGESETEAMTAAYERALCDLGIDDRDDPITELIAKAIIHVVAKGGRNPREIEQRAINALGIRNRTRLDPHYRKFFRDRRFKIFERS